MVSPRYGPYSGRTPRPAGPCGRATWRWPQTLRGQPDRPRNACRVAVARASGIPCALADPPGAGRGQAPWPPGRSGLATRTLGWAQPCAATRKTRSSSGPGSPSRRGRLALVLAHGASGRRHGQSPGSDRRSVRLRAGKIAPAPCPARAERAGGRRRRRSPHVAATATADGSSEPEGDRRGGGVRQAGKARRAARRRGGRGDDAREASVPGEPLRQRRWQSRRTQRRPVGRDLRCPAHRCCAPQRSGAQGPECPGSPCPPPVSDPQRVPRPTGLRRPSPCHRHAGRRPRAAREFRAPEGCTGQGRTSRRRARPEPGTGRGRTSPD